MVRAVPIALILLLTATPRLAAQRAAAQLAVGGGTATDVRGFSSSAVTVAPSLTLASPRSVFRLGASGTGFAGGGWAFGGGAALDLAAPAAPLTRVTVGLAARGIATSYRTSYLTLAAAPALEVALAPITLFGGLRAATARSSIGAVAAPAGPVATPAPRQVTRSATGPLFGARIRLTSMASGGVILGYRQESARIDGVGATDRVGTLAVAGGPVALTGTLGARSGRGAATTFGGVYATVDLSRVLALQIGAERYPADRLTGAVGGRAVSAGLVLRTPSGRRPPPRPSGVPDPVRGLTRLAIHAPGAATVEVAGDWNAWRPVAAHRGANGVWYADLSIPAGTWRYGFRIDRRTWRAPSGAVATDDGFGGESAWLTVAAK